MVQGDVFSFKDDLEILEILIRQIFLRPTMNTPERSQFGKLSQHGSLGYFLLTGIRQMGRLPQRSQINRNAVITRIQYYTYIQY